MEFNVQKYYQQYTFSITGVSYIGKPTDNTAMFVAKKVAYLVQNLKGHKNCLVFAENGIEVPQEILGDNGFVFTDNPQYEYAKFVTKIADIEFDMERKKQYSLINGYSVGENVEIGENAYIEPGCLIGHGVKIGKNAIILAGSIVKNAIIGDNFLCNENAVIGANAFNMTEDDNGNKMRIPALGKVRIGDNVEIGACDNVSRGTGNDTVIEDNVKIDVLIHIPHDAHLHRNVEITAGCTIGGFTEIGEHTRLGVGSVIRNRLNIGSNCMIGMGSVVVRDVEDNKTVAGNPAKEIIKK